MKRFQFQLEPVLTWRTQQADQLQQVLSTEEAKLRTIDNRLNAFRTAIEDAYMREAGQLIEIESTFWSYLQHLRNQQAEVQKSRQLQLQQVHQARLAVQAARIQQKTLEKLKEKKQRLWKADMLQKEAVELDEMANRLSFTGSDA